MGKKKIVSLVIAGMLAVGAVGGTFAWFTSKDSVTNSFSTANVDDKDPDHGIKVEEEFEPKDAKNITPGTEVNKDVKVTSLATYDQFIRVKLTPEFTGSREGVEVTSLLPSLIDLKLQNTSTDATEGTWVDGGDGYYYYIGRVPEKGETKYLLDSVTLNSKADNSYQGASFNVVVEATGVQASNRAYGDEFKGASDIVLAALDKLDIHPAE